MERIIERWGWLWKRYYEVFLLLTGPEKLVLSVSFAVLTAISAQVYIPLPFTPVPITGQVFVVLLCGVLLGKTAGSLGQIFYLVGGVAGINWFYGTSAGLLRPTTGYIIGFILAAYLTGLITEQKRTKEQMIYGMLSGIGIIHICGMLWLTYLLHISLYKAFLLGSLPFIPFDIVKAYFAGLIGSSIIEGKEDNKRGRK